MSGPLQQGVQVGPGVGGAQGVAGLSTRSQASWPLCSLPQPRLAMKGSSFKWAGRSWGQRDGEKAAARDCQGPGSMHAMRDSVQVAALHATLPHTPVLRKPEDLYLQDKGRSAVRNPLSMDIIF